MPADGLTYPGIRPSSASAFDVTADDMRERFSTHGPKEARLLFDLHMASAQNAHRLAWTWMKSGEPDARAITAQIDAEIEALTNARGCVAAACGDAS